jgi:hypothetical protein
MAKDTRRPNRPHFSGEDVPGLQTPKDIAVSDTVFDRLSRKWDADDAAKKAAAKSQRRAQHRSEEYQSSHKPQQWPK